MYKCYTCEFLFILHEIVIISLLSYSVKIVGLFVFR